jgi:hypothetical protein
MCLAVLRREASRAARFSLYQMQGKASRIRSGPNMKFPQGIF